MLQNTIKQIAKKISKTGYFKITHLKNDAISFTDGSNVFSFCIDNELYVGSGLFRAGHVMTGKKLLPTFESEYYKYELQDVASFIPYHESQTDNPDYILRNAIHFIFN